jgi:hypothetical protein
MTDSTLFPIYQPDPTEIESSDPESVKEFTRPPYPSPSRCSGMMHAIASPAPTSPVGPQRQNIVAGEGAQGFGFLDNMKQHGFAWFADEIDWVTLTFDWRFADYLGFDFSYTERRFKSGPLIRNFKDYILRIQHTKPFFTQWGSDPNCYMILSRYLHQICAHVFRVDVFTHIRKNLAEEYMADALAGKIPLCYEAVKAALDPGQCIKVQTAHAHQNRLRTWPDLWKALWGPPDETPKAYRDKCYGPC